MLPLLFPYVFSFCLCLLLLLSLSSSSKGNQKTMGGVSQPSLSNRDLIAPSACIANSLGSFSLVLLGFRLHQVTLQFSCSNPLSPSDFSQPSLWLTYFIVPLFKAAISQHRSPFASQHANVCKSIKLVLPSLTLPFYIDAFKPRQRSTAAHLLPGAAACSDSKVVFCEGGRFLQPPKLMTCRGSIFPSKMAGHCYDLSSHLPHRSVVRTRIVALSLDSSGLTCR